MFANLHLFKLSTSSEFMKRQYNWGLNQETNEGLALNRQGSSKQNGTPNVNQNRNESSPGAIQRAKNGINDINTNFDKFS